MTFDPSNAFDSSPASGIGAEIDMLAADFAALGVNGHHAVPLWMGKPNRFTGVVMTSAQEVLDYIAEEVKQQAAARAAAHAPARRAAPRSSHELQSAAGCIHRAR